MNITFKRADINDKPIILTWPVELHMKEFWDNKDQPKRIIYTFFSNASNKVQI